MKKFVSTLLAVSMCFALPGTNVIALENPLISSNVEKTSEEKMRYYPFIYTEAENWSWARDLIGNCDQCVPGYLYMQDLVTKEIIQIIENPVNDFCSDNEILYCLSNETSIVQTDYWGKEQRILYESKYGALAHLKYWAGVLVFADGNHIIRFDTEKNSKTDMGIYEGLTDIYLAEDTTFTWVNAQGIEYTRNENGQDVEVEEIDSEICEVDTIYNNNEVSIAEVTPYAITFEPVTFPLSEYPVGSYFSQSGSACTHHTSDVGCDYYGGCGCKSYRFSIQCEGFGRYALDRYAHIPLNANSEWYGKNNSHRHDCEIVFTSVDDMKVFFQNSEYAKQGTYLRFDGHTVIIADISLTSITLYDANASGQCMVGLREYTFEKLYAIKKYTTICRIVAHSFDGAIEKASATYHKICCSCEGYDGGNCTGYIVEEHSSVNPGKNATCAYCGYVGEISNWAPILGG